MRKLRRYFADTAAKLLLLLMLVVAGALPAAAQDAATDSASPAAVPPPAVLAPADATIPANAPAAVAPPAAAIDTLAPLIKAERDSADLRSRLNDISVALHDQLGSEQLTDRRNAIEALRTRAITLSELLRTPLSDLTARLKQLGPDPAEGTSEAPNIAAERANLKAAIERTSAAKKQLELITVEAEQLSSRAASLQRDRFFQRVFEGGKSVFNPILFLDGLAAVQLFATRLVALVSVWYGQALGSVSLLAFIGLAVMTVIVIAASLTMRRFLLQHLEAVPVDRAPSNFERLWRVTQRPLVNTTIALSAMILIYQILDVTGLLTDRFEQLVWAIMEAWLTFVALTSFAGAVLTPALPGWRLAKLDNRAAAALNGLVAPAALVYALDGMMSKMFEILFLPLQFSVALSALTAILLGSLLGMALRSVRQRDAQAAAAAAAAAGEPPLRARVYYFTWVGNLIQFFWVALVAVLMALSFGYVALAHFITTQLLSTGALVSAIYVLHHLADELILTGIQRHSPVGRFLRQSVGLGDRGVERLGVVFGTIVDLALVFFGLPVVFLQWTVTWVDLRSWFTTAFFGFNIGGVTVSPSLVVAGVFVLFTGIVLTKLLSSWVDRRVLARTELDKGVRDSVRKGIGYTGYLLAAVLALTAAGVDFSSIALIAGALGVGIGFGLQSIVNNFVSGLILLAERPVKVGDWIVVGAGEGFVKRINVRSTEIETFDGASIIVPNAALISDPVKNWTHTNTSGKMIITVRVARDEDPERIREILIRCCKAHPGIAHEPEPWVLLTQFGDWTLDFALNFFVPDVVMGVFIASDIRFAVLKSFREEGVVLPYPQREVHTREVIHAEPLTGRRGANPVNG